MKKFVMVLSLVWGFQAFAAGKEFVCESKYQAVLKYNENYGELTVTNSKGTVVVDQDAIILGKTRFFETSPSKTVTALHIAGSEDEKFAEFVRFGNGKVQIVLNNIVYTCN